MAANNQKVSHAACKLVWGLASLAKEYDIALDVLLKRAIDSLDDEETSATPIPEKEN